MNRFNFILNTRAVGCAARTLPFRYGRAAGFTLLEMVLVLFLVGLMASASMMLTEGVEDQAKYDETKRRMEMIRKAIVGDPTRTVNGGPEISGFVAEMGRLPECIAELLELGDEKVPNTDPKTYDSPCDASKTIALWHHDAATGVGFGWRGPYIHVLPERDGALRFRDGYGNSDANDAINSGWIYSVSGAEVKLTSAAFDADSSDDIAVNQLVVSSDWEVDLDSWSGRVLFNNTTGHPIPNPTPDISLKLRIFFPKGDGAIDYADSDVFQLLASDPIPANSSKYSQPIIFSGGDKIPLGLRSVQVLCASNDKTFKGDCPVVAPPDMSRKLTMLPFSQSTQFNFIWDI